MKKQELYYATSNSGKFHEVEHFMRKNAPFIAIEQYDVDLDEIQSLDQKLIALDKAAKAWEFLKKPVLIDDGGIYFEKYNHFPGTLSKYVFQGLGFDGISKLVKDGDRASFILTVAYTDGKITQAFEGRCDGTIVWPSDLSVHPKLPFTAIFKPDGSDKTYAAMRNGEEFEHFSFRQRALKKFLIWYTNQ